MEAEGTRRVLTRRRKPLSDRTNTSHNISSSSSCSSKLSQAKDKPSRASATTTTITNVPTINLDNASSNPSTPPPPRKPSSIHGTVDVDLEAHEPISVVYSRRSASRKRKDKGKAAAFDFGSAPPLKISDSRQQSNVVEVASPPKAKALTVPCSKKRRAVSSEQNMSKDPQLEDYIENQKKYFKSVDDFELLVEEVESIDQLD